MFLVPAFFRSMSELCHLVCVLVHYSVPCERVESRVSNRILWRMKIPPVWLSILEEDDNNLICTLRGTNTVSCGGRCLVVGLEFLRG